MDIVELTNLEEVRADYVIFKSTLHNLFMNDIF